MSFGSSKKINIKTKRISSSSIINKQKKNTLVEHFAFVKEFKNNISKHIFNHKYMLLTSENKKLLIAHAKQFNNSQLYSWEVQKIFQQSVDFYSNWMDQLIKNNKFFVQKEYKIISYKRNVTNKNGEILSRKGDIKSSSLIKKNTSLSNIMNWLVFFDESGLDSILKSIPNKATPKQLESAIDFNKRIDELRSKPYWERVKTLISNKKMRILNKIKEPIVYSTGSYMKIPKIGKTKHSHIYVDESNTYQYWYNFRIGKEHLHIPLAFNKKYHKDINQYNLDSIHTVRLNSKNHIDIGLTYEDEKEYFKPLTKDSIIKKEQICGIDLNVATNFCTIAFHDSEKAIDYNREYIKKVVNKLKEFEEKGYKKLSKFEQKQLNKLLLGVEFHFKQLISSILKELVDTGITDIVLEDLNLSQCKASFIKDEVLNMKYSKLIRLLRLSSVKNWFKEQANNRGIRVHLTTPSYTSKTCSKCHSVEHTVRQQRSFKCNACGHEDDADNNASVNVRNRIFLEVLRNMLHVLKDGQYEPLKMRRETVRIRLSELFEAVNERQRLSLVSDSETPSFRAG